MKISLKLKKPPSVRILLFGISILQLLLQCPDAYSNKLQTQGGMLLIQSESEQSGGVSKSIQSLLEKAWQYESQGEFKKADSIFDSALTIARVRNYEPRLYYLMRKKGVKFLEANELDSALVYFRQVEDYAAKNGKDTLLADVYLNFGQLANIEGRQQNCLDLYNSSLEIYKKNNDSLGMAGVFNNFALFYKDAGDYDKALEYAILNLKYQYNYKDTYDYVNSIINLGNIYNILGENDTALARFEEAHQLSNKYNYERLVNYSLINRAVIYFKQEKYAEAASEFQKAIKYAKKNDRKYLMAKLYSNLGVVYRNQGKSDLALESYDTALRIGKEINDESRISAVYQNMAYLYKEEKNYKKAIQYYNQSLPIAIKRQEKTDLMDIYQDLSDIYNETGEYKKAYSYLTIATKYNDSILNKEKVRAIEDMKAKYEKEKNMARIKSLQDENKITELEKKSMRSERNTVLGVSVVIVLLLVLLLYFFRMKSRKNRIIAAQQIKQLEDEKKLLTAQSVIVGQEKERKRIAQELHDGIGVLLSTASLQFSVVSKTANDRKTKELIDKADNLLKEAGGEVRKISQNMMPAVLSKFGLIEALEDMFENLDELENLEVQTSFSGSDERLSENTEIMLYRIIQEMVNNTIKHANAANIEFSFSRGNGVILFDYKDDGVGFDFENLPRNASLGVYGIQSRVDFLHGKLIVESSPGKGTYYQISIPVGNSEL